MIYKPPNFQKSGHRGPDVRDTATVYRDTAKIPGPKGPIEFTNQLEALQSRQKEMAAEIEMLRANQRRDIAAVPKSTAVAVWKPRR